MALANKFTVCTSNKMYYFDLIFIKNLVYAVYPFHERNPLNQILPDKPQIWRLFKAKCCVLAQAQGIQFMSSVYGRLKEAKQIIIRHYRNQRHTGDFEIDYILLSFVFSMYIAAFLHPWHLKCNWKTIVLWDLLFVFSSLWLVKLHIFLFSTQPM